MAAVRLVRRGGLVLQSFSHNYGGKCVTIRRLSPKASATLWCLQSRQLSTDAEEKTSKASAEKAKDIVLSTAEDSDGKVRDHFVPITRRSIIRHLMQEKNFLSPEELKKFEQFALSLDSAIVNRYHGVLQEVKTLFDPINPDKDTIATRQWNRRERLDNEFWLLQKLAGIMEKANFRELPRATVEKALAEHQTGEGVMVSVDTDKYDVLRYWALGQDTPEARPSLSARLAALVLRRPTIAPSELYKRVVVAVRLKTQDKLLLKAFKDVPVNALEQLLPDGKIKMTKFDHGLMTFSTSVALGGVVAKVVTYLAHIHVDWTLLVTGLTGLVGFRAWSSYKNRRNAYLADLNKMLYFHNIANNRGLLALLVDRAEDELFKESLLVYTFLLTSRPPSAARTPSGEQLPAQLGSLPQSLLELRISDWVERKTGSGVTFQSAESVRVLADLGILSDDDAGTLHVLPLEGALRNLPLTPQSLAARKEEADITEGYDDETTARTDDTGKRSRLPWF